MASGIPVWFGAEAAGGDILSTLGIDWKLLTFQIVAFLLLVFVLNKWIFPVFFKIIDKRQALIDESNRAAVDAGKHAEKAQAEIERLLKEARAEAKDIVVTAKEEAGALVSDAEQRSKQQADHIIQAAHEEIAKEVIAAKKALHNETIELVTLATEKVVGKTIDGRVDNELVRDALKGAK